MAKTKLPLISVEARGAIAKSIVYFRWKGINCVREYVIPANPQTPAQIAQRALMTAAVLDLHLSAFTLADQEAWRRYASIMPKIMTGPNTFTRLHVLQGIAGKTWIRIRNGYTVDHGGAYIVARCTSTDPSTQAVMYCTTNPRFPGTPQNMSYIAGDDEWVGTFTGLQGGTVYYIKYLQSNGAIHGELGWFKSYTG